MQSLTGQASPFIKSPEILAFYSAIVTTAVEGGMDYWADVIRYEPEHSRHDLKDNTWTLERPGKAWARDFDADPREPWLLVDWHSVEEGLDAITSGRVEVAPRIRENITKALEEFEAGMIDAGDADCIIQAGLFGEIVFG